LIAQRLTTEATLQTALVMARQVEIALADSLRARPAPKARVVQPQTSGFWNFLGNIFPGAAPKATVVPGRAPSRHTEVKGLIQAFVDRSGGIDAMWVLNADGAVLYSSSGYAKGETLLDAQLRRSLSRGSRPSILNEREIDLLRRWCLADAGRSGGTRRLRLDQSCD
jgi:hypothetical protein